MYWIALSPSRDEERTAWGWRALQYTPRVAPVDEALLLEASGSLRLWDGRKGLIARLIRNCVPLAPARWTHAGTALAALGLLRLQLRGEDRPPRVPHDLPLDVLSAAREHVATLERIGCRSWGDLRALPRAGVARRFGAGVLAALDAGFGDSPENYPWLVLPEEFDLKLELASLATTAPELMWSAQRLLTQLQVWLQARQRGVLALELEWTLDLRRLNGVKLPPHEQMTVRTSQPTQDIAHLRRLMREHLSRATLAAPASYLRLRSLETQPWGGVSQSLLPEDNVKGERLHQLVERLSVRLGEGNVVVPKAQADHRPEQKQRWVPARQAMPPQRKSPVEIPGDALYPTWLLPEPLPLEVPNEIPHYAGCPLRLMARLYRVETGWWEGAQPARRDYFIARSEQAGLVWIFREHPLSLSEGLSRAQADAGPPQVRLRLLGGQRGHVVPSVGAHSHWYLHGLYA